MSELWIVFSEYLWKKIIVSLRGSTVVLFWFQCGRYENWSDFHDDMMLVKDNCILYNPEGSTVRHDCDEVFSYFDVEYQKTLDRWHKVRQIC